MSRVDKYINPESRLVVARRGNGEWLLVGLGFLLWVMKIFWNERVVLVE